MSAAIVGAISGNTATAMIKLHNAIEVSPTSITLAPGATQRFIATTNGQSMPGITWSVGDVPGGNALLGTISADGAYTAPSTTQTSAVVIKGVYNFGQLDYATATVTIFDSMVAIAHDRWLDGVAEVAASYGCIDITVQQQPTEPIADVVSLFGLAAKQGSCLVLWPISGDAIERRYSIAWGGVVSDKDILYISDVGQMRIWNGIEVVNN